MTQENKITLQRSSDIKEPDYIPTGLLSLDLALGGRGFPRGRVIELYGPEAGGKSSLILKAVSEAQKLNLGCVYVDLERTYDPKYARVLGVNPDKMAIATFETGEETIDNIENIIKNWPRYAEELNMPNELGMVVIDSVAALLPEAERDSDIGDSHVGVIARLMSRVSRKFTPLLSQHNICMVYINQLRSTISSMPFAPKTTTTGGNAIKYYASIRLDIRRMGNIRCKEQTVGANVRIMINKSKMAGVEGSEVLLELYHGNGFSELSDLIELAEKYQLTEHKGAWYNYNNNKLQGKDGFKRYLLDNPNEINTLRESILTKVGEVINEINTRN